MWLRLVFRPWWVRWLAYWAMTAPVAVVTILVGNYPSPDDTDRWTSPLWWTGAALITAGLSLLIAISSSARRTELRACLAGVHRSDYLAVSKAVRSGPIPDAPHIRAAAARLARFQHIGISKYRWALTGIPALNTLLQGLTLLNPHTPPTLIHLLLVIAFAALTVYYHLYPRLLDARAQLLNSPTTP